MTLVTFLVTSFSTSGFPATNLAWELLAITTFGTILVYVGQSVILPSTSVLGNANTLDIVKGLIVAVGNGLSSFVATFVVGSVFSWRAVAISVGGIFMGYLVKQFTVAPKV